MDPPYSLTGILIHFLLLLLLLGRGLCRLDFPLGSRVTVFLPPEYQPDFRGRAFLMGTETPLPDFSAALNVEAVGGGNYSCSISVFLGGIKTWASDHFRRFLIFKSCAVELTEDGELQLQDGIGRIGWRARTSGRGVKALVMERKTGNLVLIDANSNPRWQSFDFPGDVLLHGQRINASSHLISLPGNSSESYSLVLHPDKLATYLNWGGRKYSYWELNPPPNRSFAFAVLSIHGLNLFDENSKKIRQLRPMGTEPVRFLSLERTGNIGLYHYSTQSREFDVSYKSLNRPCDLPLPCGPRGICASSSGESCIQLPRIGCTNCSSEARMVKLDGVDTILSSPSTMSNISEEGCVSWCAEDCWCTAVQYFYDAEIHLRCFRYGLVGGAREVERGSGSSYWVKVPKETDCSSHQQASSNLMKKVLIVGGVVDVVVLLLIVGGTLYYFFKIRKRAGDSANNVD